MNPSAVQAPSRAEVESLLATPERRADALDRAVAVLAGSPPAVNGVVRLEVAGQARGGETWTVAFTPDSVALAPHAAPDAAVRVELSDLVDLVVGTADGALLYLAGRIEVTGDESLVLALGRALRPIGSDRSAIDPAALDPLAVSAAIGQASLSHLSTVMTGGFRDLVLSEVFRRMPEFLIAEKAERARVSIAFEVERGEIGSDVDRYVVRVAEGECAVETGAAPDVEVDATLVLAGHEFLRLALGHLNPVRGVLSGDIRVRGHVIKALAFNSVIRIPGS